jgi:hypothetical protein
MVMREKMRKKMPGIMCRRRPNAQTKKSTKVADPREPGTKTGKEGSAETMSAGERPCHSQTGNPRAD